MDSVAAMVVGPVMPTSVTLFRKVSIHVAVVATLLVLARSLPQAHAVSVPASQPVSGFVGAPTGFEASAFSATRHPALLTKSQALQIIRNAGWHINLACDVQAQYMGWAAYSMSYRTPTGELQPYGYRNAWVMTASGPGSTYPIPVHLTRVLPAAHALGASHTILRRSLRMTRQDG
jgi:hypothetical protein